MKCLILLTFLACAISVSAQSRIAFAYDAAGNRVKREIVVNRNNAPEKSSMESESYYDTLGKKAVRITHKQPGIIVVDIINYESGDTGLVDVYTVDGLRVFFQQISGEETIVDLSNKDSSLYILRVALNGNSTSWHIKI